MFFLDEVFMEGGKGGKLAADGSIGKAASLKEGSILGELRLVELSFKFQKPS